MTIAGLVRSDQVPVEEALDATVEVDLRAGSQEAVKPGPYTFADAHQATAFVTEAVETLMYLGCDIQAA